MEIKVVKILAIGCNKHFMWVSLNGEEFALFINEHIYSVLKLMGVPTCQSLRGKNHG